MQFTDSQIPKRKSKPKPNVLENCESYLRLRSMILTGKMRPFQEIGLFFGPDDVAKLQMKAPWRIATDRLRKLLRASGLASDYRVVKYQTDTPGVWFVRVRYEPIARQTLEAGAGSEPAPAGKKRGRPAKTT